MAAAYGARRLGAATSSNTKPGWCRASRPAARASAAAANNAPGRSPPARLMARAYVSPIRSSAVSRCPGRVLARGAPAREKAGDQRLPAHDTSPFRAVTVRDIGAACRVRVELLERALPAAAGAVPDKVRHPADSGTG